ncbi:Opsin-3 [Saguinus oedipus]|uniref:Opsin-3 n=1 Tax=Saguinus oedipus TaxID=9490 RepID=A0ABQ9TMG5_SAGOE|nr:Opsin-3 [Saguinus oedipus]
MYSGNRSGGQGYWDSGEAADAEGPAPAGTLSPAPLFSPGTYERLALLLGSIGLLGVGNNLLVLVLYYKFQRLRTPTHLLLVNISLSNLLVSLFGVTFTFASCLRNGWVWDTVGCVWDGFSGSLFGGSLPLQTSTSRPAARSVRPHAPARPARLPARPAPPALRHPAPRSAFSRCSTPASRRCFPLPRSPSAPRCPVCVPVVCLLPQR